jgi:hypothetical protein
LPAPTPRAREAREPVTQSVAAAMQTPEEVQQTSAEMQQTSAVAAPESVSSRVTEPVFSPAPPMVESLSPVVRSEEYVAPAEPEKAEVRRPVDPPSEQRPAASSVQAQSFALPSDLVQVETSNKAQSVQIDQPRPDEMPRRPRRTPVQSEAAEAPSSEPLVQIETRHEGS